MSIQHAIFALPGKMKERQVAGSHTGKQAGYDPWGKHDYLKSGLHTG